ncbi:hypothetical protein [Burkholderia vietnamiensis]|uniref:hypothetical protein n=1 Tax=Burkholderia vietnamiensis TaxID=60552 RepID=UPI000B0C9272|nr:hypothetical protein [Burkholderia vietnamiensis]
MDNNKNTDLTPYEINRIIKNFTNSLVFNDKGQSFSEILSIIDSPFTDYKNNDVLSMIFHKFFTNTEIPVALPIFGFLSLVSAWCVKNKATMTIPLDPRVKQLDTWTIMLAPSGSAKSMSSNIINSMVPPDGGGNSVIEPNFTKPNGPAAFVEQVAKLDDGETCTGFWIEDEVSQMFKLVETEGHPMNEIKEYLLKMKDNAKISRLSKGKELKTNPVVMTQLFINTIDSFARHISEESMKDGLMRRYQFVLAQKDEERKLTDFPLYDVSKIRTDDLFDKFFDVFSQDVSRVNYTFSKASLKMYWVMFTQLWDKQYVKWLHGEDTFYRTYMMEAWKYAVFHHIIHLKDGTEIQEDSMQWALKVVMILLNSFERFIEYRARKPERIIAQKSKMDKYIDWIRANEDKKGFGMRAFYKRFKITKEEALSELTSIKVHNPNFKSVLLDGINVKIDMKKKKEDAFYDIFDDPELFNKEARDSYDKNKKELKFGLKRD